MDGGSLQAAIDRSPGGLPERLLARVAADMLPGLAWLHDERRLIHRDVKPANILLARCGVAKLSDFGISRAGEATGASVDAAKGTWCYMAPERLDGRPYGPAADVWALGLALLTAAAGAFPYALEGGPIGTALAVLEGPPARLAPAAAAACPLLDAFLGACLRAEAGERPAAAALARHAWLQAPAPHAAVAAFLQAAGGEGAAGEGCGPHVAAMFTQHFYELVDAAAPALGSLYRAGAVAALRDAGVAALRLSGGGAIAAALGAQGATRHTVEALDWQALEGGGVLVLTRGRLSCAGWAEARAFSEALTFVPESEGRWLIANQWRCVE